MSKHIFTTNGPTDPDDPRRCTGIVRRTGERCKLWAVTGLPVCKRHGANKPAQEANLRKIRLAEQETKAIQFVDAHNLRRDVDPWTALLEGVSRSAGLVQFYAERLAELDDSETVFGVTEVEEHEGFQKGRVVRRQAGEHIWSQLYFRERKHLAAVARDAIVAGVAERQVRIAEEQGHVFAEMIRAILGDLGVERSAEVDRVVHRHLSVVPVGA